MLRQPYGPWSQPRGSKHSKKLRGSITTTKRWAVQSRPAERDVGNSSFGWQQGTRCPPSTRTWCSGSQPAPRQHEHTGEARLRPLSCTSTSTGTRSHSRPRAARDQVTGQEGRRHFDQAGLALNSFHTDTSATGISAPTPQTSRAYRHILLWHVNRGQSNAATGGRAGLDEGCSHSKVTAASSLEESRGPPYALSEEIRAQQGTASLCTSSPQACASCPQNSSNQRVWRQLAGRGWWFPAAPLLVVPVGAPPPAQGSPAPRTPHSPLLAGRGLTMPRELQAASSLPSREQWGHCGRPGKCGQIPGTGSFPLGGSFLPRTLLLHSGRSAVGCQPFPRRLEENRAGSATGTLCQRAWWPCRATRSYQFV